jgi:hypothetical protein
MRVIDRITGQRLSVDEAYDRFFDGFYNLGRASEIFSGTMILAPPRREPVKTRRVARARRRSAMHRRGMRRLASHK